MTPRDLDEIRYLGDGATVTIRTHEPPLITLNVQRPNSSASLHLTPDEATDLAQVLKHAADCME